MVSKEELNSVYESVIKGEELTTKKLRECGISSKDINDLIEEGKIRRVKRGYYELTSAEDLFFYGKYLLREKRKADATRCFEICYEINPNHLSSCFQLFLRSIENDDFERAFELFDKLRETDNEFYQNDSNYFLFLLSNITEVPEKYKEYAKFLTIEDMRVLQDDKRYQDIPMQNRARYAAYQKKFSYALKQLNELITKHKGMSLQDLITKSLLIKSINAETKSKSDVLSLAKEEDYNGIVDYLTKKGERVQLSITENYILSLASTIIDIQKSRQIPKIDYKDTTILFEAIDSNNFELALSLNEDYNSRNQISNEKNALNILLINICKLIKEIKEKNAKPKVEEKKEEPNKEITFASIVSKLLQNKTDIALANLKVYMKSLGMEKYEFIIANLIRISILENDMVFTKPMIALSLMCKDGYKFDISSYIQEFYIALSNRNFEVARIYLEIITTANKQLGIENIQTDGLYQVLESYQKPKEEPKVETVQEVVTDKKVEVTPKVEKPKVVEPVQPAYVPRDSEKKYLDRKYNEMLERKSIALLKPMEPERIDQTLDMLEDYPDVHAYVVKGGEKEQIVLKYKPKFEERYDLKQVFKDAEKSYQDGKYEDAMNGYLLLLQAAREPKDYMLGKMGIASLKLGKIPDSIEYLTLSTIQAKMVGKNYDYSDLINKISGKKAPSKPFEGDTKPKFDMKLSEFNSNDINNYYGITNMLDISLFILDSGVSIDEACEAFNLSPEKTNIVKLIFAREHYIFGNYDTGDGLLVAVEKSKAKDDAVKKFIDELKRNKRFYRNREITDDRPVILSATTRS